MRTAISANNALPKDPRLRVLMDTLIGRAVLKAATMLLVAILVGLLFLMLAMPIITNALLWNFSLVAVRVGRACTA